MTGFVRDVVQKIDPYQASQAYAGKLNTSSDEMGAIAQKIMLDSMSYFELLSMSPKYKTFMKLRQLYETFDADLDVLTLEMGDAVYRGYFLDFSFTHTAANPWNWKYTIGFIALANLAENIRRGDEDFPKEKFTNILEHIERFQRIAALNSSKLDTLYNYYNSLKNDKINNNIYILTILSGVFLPLNSFSPTLPTKSSVIYSSLVKTSNSSSEG